MRVPKVLQKLTRELVERKRQSKPIYPERNTGVEVYEWMINRE